MYSAGQIIWRPLSLPSIAVYRFNLHPGVPLFKKFQHPSLYRITVLTESFTIDSRWSKNAWCKVAALQFTIHLIPEVTHDITVRQVVDCQVMTAKLGFVVICICKYTWIQQDHLKVHGENHDVIVSFGLLFIILLFLSRLFFSLFMLPEVLFGHSTILMSKGTYLGIRTDKVPVFSIQSPWGSAS